MRKSNTDIFSPKSLNELLDFYSENRDAVIFAGALGFMKRGNNGEIKKIISITSIPELKKIHRTDKYIDLGAATTISQILRIGQFVIPPVLYDALKYIGPPSIRNIATIGGNILQSSHISNTLPVLCALNAGLEIRNISKSRWLPSSHLISNTKDQILDKDEILVRIRIPLTFWHTQVFRKITTGSDINPGELIFCGLAHIAKSIINDLRIIIGRPGEPLYGNRTLETYFIGKKTPITDKNINQLTDILNKSLEPSDKLGQKEFYLRNTSIRLIINFLKKLKQ